jgi:hypothetical protein
MIAQAKDDQYLKEKMRHFFKTDPMGTVRI